MTYTVFNGGLPDGATQDGTQVLQSVRDNLNALRDACIVGGFYGFNMTTSGGTAENPALLTYNKGVERVKAALTWGATGGGAGNVVTAVYAYSNDSGSTYSTIGTKTITYDGSGNVTATAWS